MSDFVDAVLAGEISWLTVPVWLVLAVICGVIGGALGGLKVGAAALGKELAMLMGAFYGPFAAGPGIVLAIIVIALTMR